MRLGIGVQHQLVVVETVAGLRLIGTVNAITIDGAGAGVRQVTVPDFVGVFGQLDPLQLGFAGVVEQA